MIPDGYDRGRGSRCEQRATRARECRPLFRRGRFDDILERQLALFERENEGLLREVDAALDAYNAADRDEAERRYERYLDLVETAQDELVALRDAYAVTLDGETASEYEAAFNARVRRKLPRYALGIE